MNERTKKLLEILNNTVRIEINGDQLWSWSVNDIGEDYDIVFDGYYDEDGFETSFSFIHNAFNTAIVKDNVITLKEEDSGETCDIALFNIVPKKIEV